MALSASAAVYDLIVDPAFSEVVVAPSSFDGLDFVPAEPQGADSLRTRLTGRLRLEITHETARLLPGSELVLENNGDWHPGPFAYDPADPRSFNTNSGPANYAYRYLVPFEFFVAVRQLRFNVSHDQPVPLSNQTFTSAGAVVTIPHGYGDLTLGNPPQSNLATYPPTTTTADTSAALILSPDEVTLTLPLRFEWQLSGVVTIRTTYEGVVTARLGNATPALSLERLPDGRVRASWSAAFPGFRLVMTRNLSDKEWFPVPTSPETDGDRMAVTLAPDNSPEFFRLQQP